MLEKKGIADFGVPPRLHPPGQKGRGEEVKGENGGDDAPRDVTLEDFARQIPPLELLRELKPWKRERRESKQER